VIKDSTILALCEEAGVDPQYVSSVQITPKEATFVMYSQDMRGNRYIDKQTNWAKTYWVKVKVDRDC
jgi:hypothetical protein